MGVTPFNQYLKLYKVGDDINIKVDGDIHKVMFHKFYHGRTVVIFNVIRSFVGIVVVNKVVNGRILKKWVNILVENIQKL